MSGADTVKIQTELIELRAENEKLKQVLAIIIETLPTQQRAACIALLPRSVETSPSPLSTTKSLPPSTFGNNLSTSTITPSSFSTTPSSSFPSPTTTTSTGVSQQPPPVKFVQPPTYNSIQGGSAPPPPPTSSALSQPTHSYNTTAAGTTLGRTGSTTFITPAAANTSTIQPLTAGPSLIPITHTSPQFGTIICGTTHTQQSLSDLQLMVQGKKPSFLLSLQMLVQYLTQWKERTTSNREDLAGSTSTTATPPTVPFDPHGTSGKIFSPIEYLRFLTCVAYNLPYNDTNDSIFKLFHFWGLPLLIPIDFSSSLTYTQYIQSHSGFYSNTRDNTAPGSYTMLYVSNTSDCDVTFWFRILASSPLLMHYITSPSPNYQTAIYLDSYLTMTYFHVFLGLSESISYLASCWNLINCNVNNRRCDLIFGNFFDTQPQRRPNTITQVYEWLWSLSHLLHQFVSNAPVGHVTGSLANTQHWLVKTLGQNTLAAELLSNLTQFLVSSELFHVAYGTTTVTPTIKQTATINIKHYKAASMKLTPKKSLTSSDLLLINNIKTKLSVQLRDIYSGSSTVLVNNYTQNTQNATMWLKDMVATVANS